MRPKKAGASAELGRAAWLNNASAWAEARVLDVGVIEEHTSGFDELAAFCRAEDWTNLEAKSG
jgi:hypothetical protein